MSEEPKRCPECDEPLKARHFGWMIESYRCDNNDCPITDVILVKDYPEVKRQKKLEEKKS